MKKLPENLLEDFIKENREQRLNIRQVNVYVEGYQPLYHAFLSPQRENIYSGSKTYTAVGVGIAIDEGLIGIDDKLTDYFPEYAALSDSFTKQITVRDLLKMRSGKFGLGFRTSSYDTYKDYAQIYFEEGVRIAPGTKFCYNNPNTYMLGRIVEKASGEILSDYLKPRLFDPLGYFNVQWNRCPNGHTIGFTGLQLSTREYSNLGRLLLQNGVWGDRQLISSEFVKAMHTDTGPTSAVKDNPELAHGYGYHIWMGSYEQSYRAAGLYGQYSIVYPTKNMVVTVTARHEQQYKIIRSLERTIADKF